MSNTDLSNEVLVNLIQDGLDPDNHYMMQLWDKNQAGIKKIVNQYLNCDCMEDLMQEAFIGLQKAIEQYEPKKGMPFFNHAMFWINNTLSLYVRHNGKNVYLPYTVYSPLRRKRRFVQQYKKEHSEAPTDQQIADALNISIERLNDINQYEAVFSNTASLDKTSAEEDGVTLADHIPVEDHNLDDVEEQIFRKQISETVWSEVDQLPENLSKVIRLRYKNANSLNECAELIGASLSCVYQRQRKAEKILGQGEHREKLLPCIDWYKSALSGSLGDYNRTQTSTTERIAIRNIERERKRYDRMIARFLQQFSKEDPVIRAFIDEVDIDADIINNTVNRVFSRYLAFCQVNGFQPISKIEFGKQVCRMLDVESVSRKINNQTMRIYVRVKHNETEV